MGRSITTIITGRNTNSRKVQAALRDAQDFGMQFYRKKFMPLHFRARAAGRYGSDYAKKPGSPKARSRHKRGREKRKRANQGKRRLDRKNTIPLFLTGLLQAKILKGGAKHSGRWDRRKIEYNPPFYLYISSPGTLNKEKALASVTQAEEDEITQVTGDEFERRMSKSTTTKRG